MQSIRCVACSLVNFATSSACKRCGSPFTSSENSEGQFHDSLEFSSPGSQPSLNPSSGPGDRYDQYRSNSYASAAPPKRKTRGVIVLALLCLAAAVGIPWYLKGSRSEFADISWREFKADDGAFSILVPQEPQHKSLDQVTPQGSIKADMYLMVTPGKTQLVVGAIKFPATQSVPADQLFDRAFESMTGRTGAVIVGRRNIMLDGYQGVEWDIKPPENANLPNDKGVARLYWAAPTFYMVMIGGPDSPESAAARKKYLDSFKIIRAH